MELDADCAPIGFWGSEVVEFVATGEHGGVVGGVQGEGDAGGGEDAVGRDARVGF